MAPEDELAQPRADRSGSSLVTRLGPVQTRALATAFVLSVLALLAIVVFAPGGDGPTVAAAAEDAESTYQRSAPAEPAGQYPVQPASRETETAGSAGQYPASAWSREAEPAGRADGYPAPAASREAESAGSAGQNPASTTSREGRMTGEEGAGGSGRFEAGTRVRVGAEVLLSDSLHLVRGKRVGLITNHTGVFLPGPAAWIASGEPHPEALRSTIDALHETGAVELASLFGPEHGLRGNAEAGVSVEDGFDSKTEVPIYSLYGSVRRPTRESLAGLDALVFDMQDVGARYYTYVYTMALAMEAAGEAGISFVVLDRPNPIGGAVQGNILSSGFESFVGMYPLPMRHGMTAGELARAYVGEFGVEVELQVIPMRNWEREMSFQETGLPWIPPSPNMPNEESALAYPGTCLFEGTPLSVGRGTAKAFQWIGAPWLDGAELAASLNAYRIPGVYFEPATFTPIAPGDGKFDGIEVHGVRFTATSDAFDAPRSAVAALIEARSLSGERWAWREAHFDRLAGTDELRRGIEAGAGLEELTSGWEEGITAFQARMEQYLLY